MKKLTSLLVALFLCLHIPLHHKGDVSAKSGAASYSDYSQTAYWADSMSWGVEKGIIQGFKGEGKLKPTAQVTEGQYVTMLLRYLDPKNLEATSQPFAQYKLANHYQLPVKSETEAKPLRRGNAARILADAVTGKDLSEYQAVQWFYTNQLSAGTIKNGKTVKTYEAFNPNSTLSRADAVTFIYRLSTSSVPSTIKKVAQATPKLPKAYSIRGVNIDDSASAVRGKFGAPIRATQNEYGTQWNTYHQNYQNFFMVSYHNGKVGALYTNQPVFNGPKGIKIGSRKTQVRQVLGAPLKYVQKNGTNYEIADDQYDTYLINGTYVTFFYDKFRSNTLTAVQLVKKEVEMSKSGYYGSKSLAVQQGFAYQLFDLTNATRKKEGFSILKWNSTIAGTAKRHSADMAKNNYFDHYNKQVESPFDRMHKDGIRYSIAGENIAMGQFSSIYAHEALMNSMSHRTNILQPKWTYLGVGVVSNKENLPYYTEDYFTP